MKSAMIIPKVAAVLILIMEIDGKEMVLLTKRNSKMRSHAGQICFPGGKFDITDKTIIDTAIRESYEEIGLITCKVFQILQPCISANGLLVYPVLANCEVFEPILNVDEVEKIYYFEFKLFLKPKDYNYNDWDMSLAKFYEKYDKPDLQMDLSVIRLHQFKINDTDTVWGLTAELGVQAASFYYNSVPEFCRKSEQQLLYWWEVTERFFESLK